MGDDLLKLGAVLGLVLMNGFFVAAEFALVSVRSTRIDQLIEQGHRMARLVKRAQADPNRFISAAQVGITMASLALGWIAEPALATIIAPAFAPIIDEHARIGVHLVAGVLAYFLVTLLHIVIGEQVPKMIALQRSEATILASAGPITWLAVPFRPLIALLYWLTALILRPLGLSWQGEHHLVYSEDELKMLVTASQQQGYLEESEQELISRVFGFADIEADEAMVPRTEMVVLPATATLPEVTATVAESGHARYPVYDTDLDDIIGIFHVKDLYRFQVRGRQGPFNLGRMVRAPIIVHSATPLDQLLAMMKRQRTHVAIVLDEYGGTAGMVTLEDVLERIVGDVRDEFEVGLDEIVISPNGETHLSGLLSIDEVNERFGLEIDDPFYNTIGGYVFGQLGRRPDVGDEVRTNGHVFRIEAMDGLRIDRLLLISAAENALEETRDETADPAVAEQVADEPEVDRLQA
ncbi:MAG: magnesium and cobalt exporter, family [Thermomicrobiales bacterium]|jgi:CBS domain containing-hemolysin-like protein|nr:magnesium and cobalt exporter, family [Thermomicrobiales bacterium]